MNAEGEMPDRLLLSLLFHLFTLGPYQAHHANVRPNTTASQLESGRALVMGKEKSLKPASGHKRAQRLLQEAFRE